MGQASSSSSAASAINDSGGDFAVGGKPNVLGYVVAAHGGTLNLGSKTPAPGDLGLYLILGVFGLIAIWIIWGRKH